jgi:uncharacterized protein
MRLLSPADYRRVPWKNGRGSTLELASDASAPGGEWTWRLSIADVPARAEFSAFPGIDRFIACLSGPGLKLERSGASVLVPSDGAALAFAGEEPAAGEPLGPGVRDVNLMLRRGRWRGRMTVARGRELSLDAGLVLVHAPDHSPSLRVGTEAGACELSPGSTLILSGVAAMRVAAEGAVVACELSPV